VGSNCRGHSQFPQQTFFWCTDAHYTFSELPAARRNLATALENHNALFSGLHTDVVCHHEGRAVTELDRLSLVVSQIHNQCTVVPVGSYKKNPLHEVNLNEAFQGVMMEKICDLSSYMHLRPVQTNEKKSLCARNEDIFRADFLDSAANGSNAKNVWTVTRDVTQRFAVLRSRVWPGAVAYHRANTQVFGNFYMGNGLKNHDLPFQI